jgi:hypothetical protein
VAGNKVRWTALAGKSRELSSNRANAFPSPGGEGQGEGGLKNQLRPFPCFPETGGYGRKSLDSQIETCNLLSLVMV